MYKNSDIKVKMGFLIQFFFFSIEFILSMDQKYSYVIATKNQFDIVIHNIDPG